jgi:hypothetical protein
MSLACPISVHYINENTARFNAFLTLSLLLVFLLTPFKWVLFLVVLDFLLRRILNGRFSFVSRISNWAVAILGFRRIQINAGPKLFAANVGFLLSLAALLFLISGLHTVSYVLAGTLVFFTFLESVLNYCVACVLYPFVSRYLA